jgi:hypothetical protein
MRGPIPRVLGPVVLSVHHGLEQWSGSGLTRACARALEPGREKRVAGGAVGEVAAGAGAFYMAGGEGAEAVRE